MNNENMAVYPPYRLVAQFADGARLLFDGLTEAQAQQSMEAAQAQHGDIAWYDGVTDLHYENGKYYKLIPPPPEVTLIDLTEYTGPLDENGLPPSLTGNPPADHETGPDDHKYPLPGHKTARPWHKTARHDHKTCANSNTPSQGHTARRGCFPVVFCLKSLYYRHCTKQFWRFSYYVDLSLTSWHFEDRAPA